MSSTNAASASCPYIFPRASMMATRTLISNGGAKVGELPSASSGNGTSPSNHYERAAAEAAKAGTMDSTTASSVAAAVTSKPEMQKQRSWKLGDLKAEKQGEVIGGAKADRMGYSTTSAGGEK